MEILERTLQPLFVAERPYEAFTLGFFDVIREGKEWKMWYEAYDPTYTIDSDVYLCYATSRDGIHWERPNLGLIAYQGSKDNNILVDGHTGAGGCGHHVFVDPQAPKNERYKMVYIKPVQAHGTLEWWVFGATSPDGIYWTWLEEPLLKENSDTQVVCFRDGNKYRLYVRMWSDGLYAGKRIVGYTESPTFGNFPAPTSILATDAQDPDELQYYNSATAKVGDGIYVMFPSGFYTKQGMVVPHAATSNDGKHFTRLGRGPFLPLGTSFDDKSIYVMPGLIPGEKLGTYWVYYLGTTREHDDVDPAKQRNVGGYGRFLVKIIL